MKLEYFYYIQAISVFGSISKASEYLNISQPYLSLELKNLEKELNISLLKRNNRGVELTEAGKIFVEYAINIIELTNQATSTEILMPNSCNRLSIATMYSYTFLDAYHQFTNECVGNGEIISYEEMPTDSIAKKIRNQQYDIGFIYLDDKYIERSINQFKAQGLQFEPLFTEDLAIVVNSKHPLAKRKSLSISDLKGYKLILEKSKQSPNMQLPIRDIVLATLKNCVLEPVFFDSNRSALYYVTKDTSSFSFGQKFLNTKNPFFRNKEIVYIPIKSPTYPLTTGYLLPLQKEISPICEKYINFIKAYFSQQQERFPLCY